MRWIAVVLLPLALLSCAEARTLDDTYEAGDLVRVRITNTGPDLMAFELTCTFPAIQFRAPGSWKHAPVLRPACISPIGTLINGVQIPLASYELLRPGESLTRTFITGFVTEQDFGPFSVAPPAVVRAVFTLASGCDPPESEGAPIQCAGSHQVTSNPVLVVIPGTKEAVSPLLE